MENNTRMPILKGRPFFDQLKQSIHFIDSNMKLIDNSVKTSNADEEFNYVKKVLSNVDKFNDDINNAARCLKVNNCLKRTSNEFEDEIQNLKDILRFKEIDYHLEPFKYQTSSKPSNQFNKQQIQQVNYHQLNNQTNSNYKESNKNREINFSHPLANQFASQDKRLKLLNKNKQLGQGVLNHYSDILNDPQYLKNDKESISKQNSTQTIDLNNHLQHLNQPKKSSIKKKDTFILKENQASIIKKPQLKLNYYQQQPRKEMQQKENQADLTNESIDPTSSFDFKLPLNKLKNSYYPSNNFSVDESLEIEFTPGLKSRRTCKKKHALNESNASAQDLPQFDKQSLDNSLKQDQSLIKNEFRQQQDFAKSEQLNKIELDQINQTYIKQDLDLSGNTEKFEVKSNKLSTPKKPSNWDLIGF